MSNLRKEYLKNQLEWIDGTWKYKKELLDKVRQYEEIIIFGAGIGGGQTYELLQRYGYEKKVKAFSDNNKNKIGKNYLGKMVISPTEIKEGSNMLVLVSSTAFDLIVKQLVETGIDKNNIYYFQPAGVSLDQESDLMFIRKNLDKFEDVYGQLADDKSKKIYRCLLNYRISKDKKYLDEMRDSIDKEEEQYFDKVLMASYSFSEGFVDAGAYIGDTIENFYTYFPQYKGKYYCMEAGAEVYRQLCNTIKKMDGKDIYPYQCAAWEKKGTLKFTNTVFGDGGSRVSSQEGEGELVYCDSIDNLFAAKPVDFIKMDIEGAEKKALLGAKNIINENKPLLAICIYHRQEDFFDIPFTIREIIKDEYSFYIRQYRCGQSETVLYAMPRSRKRSNEGE